MKLQEEQRRGKGTRESPEIQHAMQTVHGCAAETQRAQLFSVGDVGLQL